MIALGIPPGIHRKHFAFENWNDFDEELFSEIYNDDSGAREFRYRIIGSDISPKAISVAEKNIRNAGLKKYIDLEVKALQQYTEAPKPAGVFMTNPPYGERIKVEDIDELYALIGERLKHVFIGYRAYILSYKKELFDKIGLKASRRFPLMNGQLECEMREYEIFAGKRREQDKKNFHKDIPSQTKIKKELAWRDRKRKFDLPPQNNHKKHSKFHPDKKKFTGKTTNKTFRKRNTKKDK